MATVIRPSGQGYVTTSGSTGYLEPDASGFSHLRGFNFDGGKKIHELWPDKTPFFTFTANFGKEMTDDPLFKHRERDESEFVHGKYFVNAATPSTWSGTALNDLIVDDGAGTPGMAARFVKGHIVRCITPASFTTKFIGIVNTVDTTNDDINITSLWKSGSPNPANNDELYIEGIAREEFGNRGTVWHVEDDFRYGSVQDFSQDAAMSDIMMNTKGGREDWEDNKLMKTWLHKLDIEKGLIFGKMVRQSADAIGTSWGSPTAIDLDGVDGAGNIYTTDGLYTLLDQYGDTSLNKLTFTKATNTYSDFIDMMEKLSRFGSSKKLAICGRTAYGFFSKLDAAFYNNTSKQIYMEPGGSVFGVKIDRLVTPYMDLGLVKSEVLRDQWGDLVLIVDMNNVKLRVMNNLDTTAREYAVEPYTGKYWQIRTVCGLQVNLLKTHGMIKLA